MSQHCDMWIDRRYIRDGPVGEGHDDLSMVFDALSPEGAPKRCVLKTARAKGQRRALAHEVSHLATLAHPAFRRVLDYEENNDQTTAVFEHIDGTTLAEKRPKHCALWVEDVLRALVFLHGRGLVHGDIKPHNIVLTSQGHAFLIDLGLATPIGEPLRGGTKGFLAPEHGCDPSVSVAGDLYALGATIQVSAPQKHHKSWARIASLAKQCLAKDPRQRPASAEAALAAIGLEPYPVDSVGQLKALGKGRQKTLRAILEGIARFDGKTIIVEGDKGAGRTRLVHDVLSRQVAQVDNPPLVHGSLAGGHNPLAALANLLLGPKEDSSLALTVSGATTAAKRGLPLLVDDGQDMDAELARGLAVATEKLRKGRQGCLVVVGVTKAVSDLLAKAGATVRKLERLDDEQTRLIATEAGAHLDTPGIKRLERLSGGLAGRVARGSFALARRPQISKPQLKAALDGAHHVAAIQGEAGDVPPSVLAQTAALQGRLEQAQAIVSGMGSKAPLALLVKRAQWLERLGHYESCLAQGLAVMGRSKRKHGPQAAVFAAAAAHALGRYDEAEQLCDKGLQALNQSRSDMALRCHLLAVKSDGALTTGRTDEALATAEQATAAAEKSARSDLLPIALSRQAAALALGATPQNAVAVYHRALSAAEGHGDVVALPPYILNLAAAEHTLGDFDAALRHYQEAARLARQLERHPALAVTQLNLAGLFAALGAKEEALKVLDEALEAARAAGSPLYTAQANLVRAEALLTDEPHRALEHAQQAEKEFSALGAERQRIEAALVASAAALGSELAAPDPALDLVASSWDELERSGLAVRAKLVEAQALLTKGEPRLALDAAESASGRAQREGTDKNLAAHSLAVLAAVHGALKTGAEAPFRSQALTLVGAVAARLPAGLRERYLDSGFRRGLKPGDSPEGRGSRSERQAHDGRAERVLAFVQHVLAESNEKRLFEAMVDEALAMTEAERAFLLRKRSKGPPQVEVARNMDQQSLRGKSQRFSRSIAEQVLRSGQRVRTASAVDERDFVRSRSIVDLKIRSALCVPVRSPSQIVGALYLDHRFHTQKFSAHDERLIQSLADIIAVAWEKERLRAELEKRAAELEKRNETIARESLIRAATIDHLSEKLERLGPGPELDAGGMIGQSPAFLKTLQVARRGAPTDVTVLIEGGSGTGKELLARYVHDRSHRPQGPFVAINCGAFPESLLESELFGHKRGSFTGASQDHAGLFRAASGGTLFLDEVAEMPLRMQTRLLRVLQEGEVRPVGSETTYNVQTRIISATNRDLREEVREKRFRNDLYYRLCGLRLQLPSLKDRLEDLPMLAHGLLKRIAQERGMHSASLSKETLRELFEYHWPGNIRELQQVLRRAVIATDGSIIAPSALELPEKPVREREFSIRRFDRELLGQALDAHGGNRTQAAKALGVSRATIHRWIARYGL